MSERIFLARRGTRLAASSQGNPEHPGVLLLAGGPEPAIAWSPLAEALAEAGRHTITLTLPPSAELGAAIEDLRAVLLQFETRPVLIGADREGWIAAAALGEGGAHLATGLVVIDTANQQDPAIDQAIAAAPHIAAPTLIVGGAQSRAGELARQLADAELAEPDLANQADPTDALAALLLDFLERRAPRVPPEYRAGSDPRTLRDALGCFATGVTVVTTMSENDRPVGLTANSFTSVSLDPPLLLVCIARTAGSLSALERHPHFGVNVLHIGQRPVSMRFAASEEDRFAATPWEAWSSGVPMLRNALASFECARHAIHDGGDHVILIGRVLRVRFEPWRDPLLYFRGKYRRLHFS